MLQARIHVYALGRSTHQAQDSITVQAGMPMTVKDMTAARAPRVAVFVL